MTLLANFTAGNGTSLGSYTTDNGEAITLSLGVQGAIQDNRAYLSSASFSLWRGSNTASGADYAVEALVHFKTDLTGASAGPALRVVGTGASLNGYVLLHTTGTWQLYKCVGGVFTALGSTVAQTLTVGSTYKAKIEAVGTTLKYWTDNADGTYVLRDTLTDSAVTAAGSPGFWINKGSSTTGYHLDKVEEVAAGGGGATATTLSGPTTGTVGVASTNFTAGADGTITGTVTVTPSDGGGGGTFSPTSVAISSGTPTATFTYTAGSSGAKTISISDDGGLTDATSITYTASGGAATATTLSGPTSGTVGVASTNFTAGANGTITGTVTVTPGDGGAGGTFTPTTVNISSGTPTATFTYTAASSGAKTISIADNGGLTDATSITYTASAASNPVAGTASLSSTTATTINVTCGAASSGTPSYTYQWYRSPTANFTPGGGTLLSGATSLTLADSTGLSADTPYYYRLRVTDSLSNVGDSNEIAGVLKGATLSIGFIGDSITNAFGLSAGQGPVDQAGNLLVKLYKNRAVTVTEYAVDGTRTAQWLSGSANLIAAKAAFASASATHVHIMFGANDAAAANLVSAATYKSNLQDIITDLTGAGYKVILSYPTYIPAGANSNATTAASVALAQSYQAQIDDLIDGVNVLRGDVLSYNYFIANLSEYQTDKTHPTATGATSLGYMWARAIERAIFFLDKPVPTKTVTVTFKDRTGALQANLTGLKWQWSDFPGQPIDYGTGETTDASGVFTVNVRSYLQTGDVGFLEVTNAAGVVNTTYLSFAGPAPIA